MKNKKLIVKVTIPRIITDNPMCCFSTRDGSWVQEIPINQQIVKWLAGKHEGYFELVMNAQKIVSMKQIEEGKYYADSGESNVQLSKT